MAKKKVNKKKKKGFTLIELLIVIAIIGILASIVLVSLSSARQRAKMAEFKAAVSSLNSAMIVECDSVQDGASVLVWPAGNTSSAGVINNLDAACSLGEIAADTVTIDSDSAVTGGACTATLGQNGVIFGGSC